MCYASCILDDVRRKIGLNEPSSSLRVDRLILVGVRRRQRVLVAVLLGLFSQLVQHRRLLRVVERRRDRRGGGGLRVKFAGRVADPEVAAAGVFAIVAGRVVLVVRRRRRCRLRVRRCRRRRVSRRLRVRRHRCRLWVQRTRRRRWRRLRVQRTRRRWRWRRVQRRPGQVLRCRRLCGRVRRPRDQPATRLHDFTQCYNLILWQHCIV